MNVIFALAVALAGTGAWADVCPERVEDPTRKNALLAQLREAPNEMEARRINNLLWEVWATAPDAHAQDLLDSGMARRRMADMEAALSAFEALIAYCPTYAEGYNQRAFVLFLQEKYDAALVDLDETLARSPDHFAALAGKALTLMGLGRETEAQRVLRQALAFNPWLSERRFLKEPQGDDI